MKLRFVLAGLLSIGLPGFFALAESWGKNFVTSVDVAFMLLSGSCAILAFVVIRRMGWRGKFGAVYLGLFIGMLLVFLGDICGGIYDSLWAVTPFPSLADVFYFLGYVVAIVTMLRFLWFFRRAVDRERAFKLIVLFILFVGGLSVVFLISHSVAQVPVVALDALYPILDGVSLTISFIMFSFFRSRFISPPWRWFALGTLLIGIAHFLNGLGTTEGWYTYPQPLDLFYLWGYVSFGLGFSIQTKPEAFWRD